MRITVTVECPKGRLRHLFKMWRFGLYWAGESYVGRISERRLGKIAEYCKTNRLKYKINENFSERSNNYRKVFFDVNEPYMGNRYFCAYCGRLVKKDNITVDHLYPVGAAKKSVSLQRKLKRHGITNINDAKNLVPACKRCNSSKGKKMGTWIIRGRIGRHPALWVIRHIIRVCLVMLLVWILYKYGVVQEFTAIMRKNL